MSNNSDITKMLTLFEGKEVKKEKVEDKKQEVKEFEMKPTPKSKKGMFKGKTKEELKKMRTKVKAQMKSHEDKGETVPEKLRSKLSQINFALRAKHDWGTAESKEVDSDKEIVKEDIEFKQLKKYLAENFWGGADTSSDEGSGGEGSGEEEPHYNGSGEAAGEETESDTLKMDIPVFIKFLEYARENAKSDEDLHELAEKMAKCAEGGKTLTMQDYEECCGGVESCGEVGDGGHQGFGGSGSGEGSGESMDDGFNRSAAAESVRHILNLLK
jgi:hypothetical protein